MSSSTDLSIPVTVNGDRRTVPEDYPLTELLRDLEIDPENEDETAGVAVALNDSVVRRQDWGDVRLAEGDSVEIIQAQPGG
ncbi:sulfur carrier protein ThiS [Salinibacter altiplanensis]|uniref:sulfur carrier protein ThiS n=1 Tax=Salinibacter altiplanensis TaxID=1803181 RepID=UPI000C9FDB3F|nr:sulfur carrier protein ThiS [Salinibacter altiplanensis]